MRRKYDEGYLELKKKVEDVMPNYYGVLLSVKYPKIKPNRVYNVFNHGVQDWEVVKAMADVLQIKVGEEQQ